MSDVPYLYPLFEHMANEHGLTLLDSELLDIIAKAEQFSPQLTEARARIAKLENAASTMDFQYRAAVARIEFLESPQALELNQEYGAARHRIAALEAELKRLEFRRGLIKGRPLAEP